MGRLIVTTGLVLAAVAASGGGYLYTLDPRVSPAPRQVTYASDVRVRVDAVPVTIRCDDGAAGDWAKRHLGDWLRGLSVPPVRTAPRGAAVSGGEEAYRLDVTTNGVTVVANTLQGVRYALYTYRQTWEASRGTPRLTHYTAPTASVDDAPALAFRAIHLCWFRADEGCSSAFMEHQLRMAAYSKFNYAVVENFGGLRSECHPELGYGAGEVPLSEVRRLAAVAKDLGLTVIPGLNLFGHASLGGNGKHAALDPRPELQPLFEPRAGWNWCLSNPSVLAIHKDLISEAVAAWGDPPYVHIGCDEADPPSCSACCTTSYHDLVLRHLKALHEFAASQGLRLMMWHDKLLSRNDARFKGFNANGNDDADRILRALPRDIVICDWYYGGCWGSPELPGDYPTLDFFNALGFEVVSAPWYNPSATKAQAKWVIEHRQKGLLVTTWARNYGEKYAAVWTDGPTAAWGTAEGASPLANIQDVETCWRHCGWDMDLKPDQSGSFGWVESQFSRIPEHCD